MAKMDWTKKLGYLVYRGIHIYICMCVCVRVWGIYEIVIWKPPILFYGLPWWLRGKESTRHAGGTGDPDFTPWVGKSPWRSAWQPCTTLTWRIPWTEECGGLQSTVLQRVGRDWSDLAHVVLFYKTLSRPSNKFNQVTFMSEIKICHTLSFGLNMES